MTAEKISDSVGKKIVEALKMQNQGVAPVEEVPSEDINFTDDVVSFGDDITEENVTNTFAHEQISSEPVIDDFIPQQFQAVQSFDSAISSQSAIDSAFTQSINQNLGAAMFSGAQSTVEYPANIAVLNSLIAKLPTGVSRQTGALIIRQTMEALGISMQAVIQEAKQVQDDLSSRARECQKNIVDYRKQISALEIQAQQYQKQVVTMNDIISLFVHTK